MCQRCSRELADAILFSVYLSMLLGVLPSAPNVGSKPKINLVSN